jgi:archaellum biogenesis protein FlaJ (TadC family)
MHSAKPSADMIHNTGVRAVSESYLRRVSARIVRMFEFYIRNIDPDDEHFQTFIKNYVSKESKEPQTLLYSVLYKIIQEGIRQYISEKKEGPKK